MPKSGPWMFSVGYLNGLKDKINDNTYDLFLLTQPDLVLLPTPCVKTQCDGNFFMTGTERELDHYGFTYEVITGNGDNRTAMAVSKVLEHFPDALK
jgi:hypothetical protein